MDPPPAKGSRTGGGLPPVLLRISSRACSNTSSLLTFSHLTNFSMILKRRFRSFSCASSVGNRSGWLEGSSTSWANRTARQAAKGRRAHHRWRVLGWPCRIDFSRADSLLIASRGNATSISFFFGCFMGVDSLLPEFVPVVVDTGYGKIRLVFEGTAEITNRTFCLIDGTRFPHLPGIFGKMFMPGNADQGEIRALRLVHGSRNFVSGHGYRLRPLNPSLHLDKPQTSRRGNAGLNVVTQIQGTHIPGLVAEGALRFHHRGHRQLLDTLRLPGKKARFRPA